MSLTYFLKLLDVRAKIKPLRPPGARRLVAPLKAPARSQRSALVGTAFDYLLRFELQRHCPHAVCEKWVAESVPDMLWRKLDGGAWGGIDLLEDKPAGPYMPPNVASRRARNVVEGARKAVGDYIKAKSANPGAQRSLAEYALRLAKLDAVVRAMRLDPTFEEAAPEDVEDLLGMLALVPFDRLTHASSLYLNPTFGEASSCIGGADADVIACDLLVDLKATKEAKIKADYLDQLLGYLLLARRHRQAAPQFPEIRRLGLYFCRHGYLWTADASVWTSQPSFAELEQWFFRRAHEVFGVGA